MSAPAPSLLLPSSDDASAIGAHDAVVRRIESVAEHFVAAGVAEDAAACAQLASTVGWMNHPGRFASAPLERALRLGAAVLAPVEYNPPTAGDGAERILHVLTEAYSVGGHTRLACRWMLADAGRTHAVALTRHRPVPSDLVEVVASRGAVPIDLPAPEAGLLERAQRLRAIAAGYDLVVLHAHPDDPVPSMAFGDGCGPRPPVVFVNHADHCYWLGREAADVVVSHRELGSKLSREQRGVPDARAVELPLPLQRATASGVDRDEARRELGIRPDQVLLLTIGSEYKYGPIGGPHFLDAAEPVVARHPDALLLAVGPADRGRFAEARLRTGGRVRALGTLTRIEHLHAAADIYLESYPCSSGTAVREAAAYGIPVLTFAPDPVEAEMLGSDAGLSDVWQRAESVEEYDTLVTELILDPAARVHWGALARESVAESFDESRWVAMVEEVYRRALSAGPVTADELAEPCEELTPYDTLVHRIHACNGKQIPLENAALVADQLELIARSPAIRLAFGSLAGSGGGPEQRLRYPVALAAPVADAHVVSALVDEFRRLLAAGLVDQLRMVVEPGALDSVVPLIEAALAAGPDVDVDLVALDDPRTAHEPGTLLVTTAGDGFGDLPADDYPHQHRAA